VKTQDLGTVGVKKCPKDYVSDLEACMPLSLDNCVLGLWKMKTAVGGYCSRGWHPQVSTRMSFAFEVDTESIIGGPRKQNIQHSSHHSQKAMGPKNHSHLYTFVS
jgi:hypothetical protein